MRRPSVLVVEDSEDPDLQELARQVLSDSFDVVSVGSGTAATSLACSAMPDIVLLDVQLRGQSGIDVRRRTSDTSGRWKP